MVKIKKIKVKKQKKRSPNAFFNKYSDIFLSKISKLFYHGIGTAQLVKGNGIKVFPHTFDIGIQFWNIFKN